MNGTGGRSSADAPAAAPRLAPARHVHRPLGWAAPARLARFRDDAVPQEPYLTTPSKDGTERPRELLDPEP